MEKNLFVFTVSLINEKFPGNKIAGEMKNLIEESKYCHHSNWDELEALIRAKLPEAMDVFEMGKSFMG